MKPYIMTQMKSLYRDICPSVELKYGKQLKPRPPLAEHASEGPYYPKTNCLKFKMRLGYTQVGERRQRKR